MRGDCLTEEVPPNRAHNFWTSNVFELIHQGNGGTAVQQVFHQLLQFLQQGISAIFRFVQMIWTWSVDQMTRVVDSPWQNWPLWKQLLLVLVVGAVIWAIYKAALELFKAGEQVLAAFATLLGVLVRTLPQVVLAGLIALAGMWVLNNFDPSSIRVPTALRSTLG